MLKSKIGISIDSKALKMVDGIANSKGTSRSAVIELAVKQLLDRYMRQEQRQLEK